MFVLYWFFFFLYSFFFFFVLPFLCLNVIVREESVLRASIGCSDFLPCKGFSSKGKKVLFLDD